MSAFVIRRAVQIPLVLFFVSVLVFGLMHVTPGDPAEVMLGVYATPQEVAHLRHEFNLDKPLVEQYVLWVTKAVRGDFGTSIRTREPVREILLTRFPIDFTLAACASVIALLIAVPAGILAAEHKNSLWDYSLMALTMLGLSIPNFALALILIIIFAVHLGWVPISGIGFLSFRTQPLAAAAAYLLPTLALASPLIAENARLMRATMLETMQQDYVRTAAAKGVSRNRILRKHAFRNAILPIVTVATINFAYLVGTTITIEYVFAIPGMGSALLQAVVTRDFPVIQGITFVTGTFFIVMNIVADALYAAIDPRIVYG